VALRTDNLPLRCRCGRMGGVASDVSPSTGFRFIGYCKDCHARFLERADVVDPAGGTDIFQMPPGRVKITAGTHAVRCPRLFNKVLRWYTECCRTPTANTAARLRFPVKLAEEALDAALTSYVSRSVADFALA
jgi:hypothetical protein